MAIGRAPGTERGEPLDMPPLCRDHRRRPAACVALCGLQVLGGVDLHADEQIEPIAVALAHERLVDECMEDVDDPRRIVDGRKDRALLQPLRA